MSLSRRDPDLHWSRVCGSRRPDDLRDKPDRAVSAARRLRRPLAPAFTLFVEFDAIMLTWDRNGDDVPDVIFFDFKRLGKWDLSYWDENFDGHWTLVGYHDDGSLKPSR